MFQKLLFKKNSVLISWLISYISVLLIPIIISTVVYMESANIIEKEITRSNQFLLKQVQQAIDGKKADIERLSLQIAFNPRLQGLMYVKEPYREHHHFTLNQILQDFRIYKLANAYIDDFFVYLHFGNVVINPQSVYDMKFFDNNIQNTDRIRYAQWQELQSTSHIKNYTLMEVKDTRAKVRQNIAYIHSLPWVDPQEAVATLVILLDESKFLDSIKNVQFINDGNVIIIDKNNKVMASTVPIDEENPILYEQLLDPNIIYYDEIQGESYVVSFIPSISQDWKYVFLLPSSIFLERVQYIRYVIWTSIILCLVIGGVISSVFLRKHYKSIHQIIQTIGQKAGVSLREGYNEYRFIEESISKTLNEKEKVQNILQQQNFVLKSNLIMRLLKGRTESGTESKELFRSFEMEFVSNRFMVFILYIEEFSALFTPEGKESAWEQLKLVQFILCNVVEELFLREEHRAFMGDIDGTMMVCLVNLGLAKEDEYKNILEIIHEAKTFIEEKFFIGLTISVGNIHDTHSGIPEAYQEALEAMEYRMILGSGETILFKDVQKPKSVYDYSMEQEHQLINFVRTGDYDQAKIIMDQVFSSNFNTRAISAQMAKCILSDLVSTMIKAMIELNSDGKEEFLERLNPVERVLQSNTVIDMKFNMTEILREICRYVEQNKKSQHFQLKDNIVEYVLTHYMDVNLSVNIIGEQFHLTPAYMSKLFKEQTGVSIPDHINDIRIRRAKELLKEPGLGIGQIAERVGYNNSNAFIRTFKKYEGITPGQFKEVI